ncbi:MAG: hypothetical protein OXE87_06500 [Chloroflexi bacterium]|nr:hypothetical protein [Chloroflexota bacterium]
MKVELELEGGVREVIRELRRLADEATVGVVSRELSHNSSAVHVVEVRGASTVGPRPAPAWTDETAADFVATMCPASKAVLFHVWSAGEGGVNRDRLCQETRLAPADLRAQLISMAHLLRRFERERGVRLIKPVVADYRLQRYFIDQQFAAAASARAFGREEELGESAGRDTGTGSFRTMVSR